MLYRDFNGEKLSALGFGAMRLPVIDGVDKQIDEKAAEELIDYAMQHGVNYYDTAYVYHGGHSELVLGKILERYPRDSYYLADKFPGFDRRFTSKVEEVFEKQLAKTGKDYFDFYLLHNVNESTIRDYLDPELGIVDYLLKQKENGRIRHLGFSAHAFMGELKRFLQQYADVMEFAQLQINWMDWDFQDAAKKVELCRSYNIPVWVMEPVRGGKLAKLDDKAMGRLEALRPGVSAPEWCFRFIQSIPEVGMTLSGMTELSQVKDNIRIFETFEPVKEEERKVLFDIAKEMLSRVTVPCTACRYCVEHCPQGLDIPRLINLYNESLTVDFSYIASSNLQSMDEEKRPQACLKCGACAAVCPQNIDIPDVMEKFAAKMTVKG